MMHCKQKAESGALILHMAMTHIAYNAAAYTQVELRAPLLQVYGPSVTDAVSTSSGSALYAR